MMERETFLKAWDFYSLIGTGLGIPTWFSWQEKLHKQDSSIPACYPDSWIKALKLAWEAKYGANVQVVIKVPFNPQTYKIPWTEAEAESFVGKKQIIVTADGSICLMLFDIRVWDLYMRGQPGQPSGPQPKPPHKPIHALVVTPTGTSGTGSAAGGVQHPKPGKVPVVVVYGYPIAIQPATYPYKYGVAKIKNQFEVELAETYEWDAWRAGVDLEPLLIGTTPKFKEWKNDAGYISQVKEWWEQNDPCVAAYIWDTYIAAFQASLQWFPYDLLTSEFFVVAYKYYDPHRTITKALAGEVKDSLVNAQSKYFAPLGFAVDDKTPYVVNGKKYTGAKLIIEGKYLTVLIPFRRIQSLGPEVIVVAIAVIVVALAVCWIVHELVYLYTYLAYLRAQREEQREYYNTVKQIGNICTQMEQKGASPEQVLQCLKNLKNVSPPNLKPPSSGPKFPHMPSAKGMEGMLKDAAILIGVGVGAYLVIKLVRR